MKVKQDTSITFLLKGLVYTKLLLFDSAIINFKKAETLDSSNVEILVNIGTVRYYQKQLDQAQADLQKALRLKPDEPNAYNSLAMIQAELGDYYNALDLVNKAIAIKPKDAFFINNRGFIYLMLNKMPEALEDINRSIGMDPYNGWSYRNKGIYYLKAEKYSDALTMLTQAERLDAFIEKINFYLAETYYKSGDIAKACIHYRKSLERKEIDEKYYKSVCK
jgi:tetratricopeptide (TPR) repeat protein